MKCIGFLKTAYLFSLFIFSSSAFAEKFTFVALGDTAYNAPADYPRYEALIDKINKSKPAFSIHVGDIWGGSPCTKENFARQLAYFESFQNPLIYTPGDNEWIDCHRNGNQFKPLEILQHLRAVFYKDSQSLGKTKITLERQSQNKIYKNFPENVLWQKSRTLFATVHVPAIKNNIVPESQFKTLISANQNWLRHTFKTAIKGDFENLIIALHADIFYPSKNNGRGFGLYKTISKELLSGAKQFKKPVLLINGDSHTYIVDKPYLETNREGANYITRLQVPGYPDLKAVKVTINEKSDKKFNFAIINFR